jgi:hypothetical protein
MTPDSLTITYKSKKFFLDRVNPDARGCQIAFASDRWGIRITRQKDVHYRIIIEKTVKRRDDGGTGTQFLWDCYCMSTSRTLLLTCVCDPATCKPVGRRTRWFLVEPMLEEIYSRLKPEIDALSDTIR